MDIVPYRFRPARFAHPSLKGYWVTLYCFFDGETTHTFFHQSEYLENCGLARECGFSVHPFTQDICVTKDSFPQIFKEIEDYVSNSHYD